MRVVGRECAVGRVCRCFFNSYAASPSATVSIGFWEWPVMLVVHGLGSMAYLAALSRRRASLVLLFDHIGRVVLAADILSLASQTCWSGLVALYIGKGVRIRLRIRYALS